MTNRLARTMSRAFLALVTGLLGLAGIALASGQLSILVTEGVSMQPHYREGDLVVLAKAQSYSIGDIAAYKLSNEYDVALHRIIDGDSRAYVFQGDNNQSIDPLQPGASDLVGRAVLHIPQAGIWIKTLTTPPVLGLIAFALIASGGTAATTRHRRRRKKEEAMSRHISDRPASFSAAGLVVSSLPAFLQIPVAVTAIVGILGAGLGVAGWAGPLEAPSSADVESGTRMTFSYTADVGRSAAYDGTTANSPDPVFRKLADSVDVDFAYEGEPGTVTVAAELTSPSGWRSTVPLADPQSFSGNSYEGTVNLDLKALEAKAAAAAAVTGLTAVPVAIAVVPQVATESGAEFRPELQLSLSPLQLSLTGEEPALTVTDSSTSQRTVMAPRALGFNGWDITAGTARILSAMLLLVAAIAGAVLLVMVRHAAPLDEATGIRRRYPSLLVRVHPMTAPQGRPVIEVTSFATLAKLAERYGLLVLHWNRSGVETFVVQDESTTYRYRAAGGESSADQSTQAEDEPLFMEAARPGRDD